MKWMSLLANVIGFFGILWVLHWEALLASGASQYFGVPSILLFLCVFPVLAFWVCARSAILEMPFEGWRWTMAMGAACYGWAIVIFISRLLSYNPIQDDGIIVQVFGGLKGWFQYFF